MKVLTLAGLVQRLEKAISQGVPEDAMVNVGASSIVFEWIEQRARVRVA